MAKKLRVCIVGLGIGKANARGIAKHPNAEIVALCDIIAPKMDAFEKELGHDVKKYDNHKEMCKDSEIDAVFVGVPNQDHVPVALDVVRADKHVMVTKPLADNERAARKLVEVADKAGVVNVMSLNHRFSPASQYLLKKARDGFFGDIYYARARSVRRNGIPAWNLGFIMKGGGAFRDMGVHVIDNSWALMGRPNPVTVTGVSGANFGPKGLGYSRQYPKSVWKKYDSDDFAAGLIRFDNGASMSVESHWASHQPPEIKIELFGTKAGAQVHPPTIYTTEDGVESATKVDLEMRGAAAWDNVGKHFVDVCLGIRPNEAPLIDGLRVQQMMEAVLKSAQTGREIRIKQ